jgi:hypothetical protein
MKSIRLFSVIVLATMLCAFGTFQVQAQTPTPTSLYFPQTGHSVQGDFLRFFNTRGGLAIFGYPLTEAFPEGGRLVQYFQRVRMEAFPEYPPPDQVQLGLLGVQLGYAAGPIPAAEIPLPNDPNRRYFLETGHTVAYAFLTYFDKHGGLDIFGNPITEFKLENGRIVQYFQRARMEWHPQLPADQRVQLGNLGEIYALTRLDPSLLQPPSSALRANVPQITALNVKASLRWAITGTTGQQTLHVYVLDQRGKPVPGAASAAVVRFPSGNRNVPLPATDANGHAQVTFDLGKLNPGQPVVVQVRASWTALVAETQTSFFVWW